MPTLPPPGPPPPPPPGGDQNRGPSINASVWVFTGISTLCVLLRMYGRVAITRNPGWDDFWILVSMVLSLVYSSFASVYVHQGGGRHPYYLGIDQTATAIRTISIGNIFGIVSVAVPKLAVAVLLVRLLNPARYQKAILFTLTISCLIIQTLCAVFLWQQCTPTAGLWNPIKYHPKCWSLPGLVKYFIFAGSYSVFVDFYLAIYPMTVLWTLQISQRRKYGLSCVLGLGIVAGAVGIYKCTTLNEFYQAEDYTYVTTPLEIMSSVEAQVIIIAACLPTLRPVFLLVTGNLSNLSHTGGPSSANNSANHPSNKKSYQLHSYGSDRRSGGGAKGSKSGKGGGRDPYDINTNVTGFDEERESDSLNERILPNGETADLDGRRPPSPHQFPSKSGHGHSHHPSQQQHYPPLASSTGPPSRRMSGDRGVPDRSLGGITRTFDVNVRSDGRASQQGHAAGERGGKAQGGQVWDRGARGVYSQRPFDGRAV